MKNWKYNSKYRNDEGQEAPMDDNPYAGLPIFIGAPAQNNEVQYQNPFGSIRVVENQIYFYGDIDENNMLDLNKVLVEVDMRLQHTNVMLGGGVDQIVHLHLNTFGGSIFAAFSTVDTIRNLKSKVYTYIDGSVASAGTLISTAGHKRFMGKHAHFLIHQLSSGVYGKFSEMEDEIFNCDNLMKLLKDYYKKNTKIPMKKLEELLKRDIWLRAEECLDYGVIDEIK